MPPDRLHMIPNGFDASTPLLSREEARALLDRGAELIQIRAAGDGVADASMVAEAPGLREAGGAENFFLFGLTAEQVLGLLR